MKLLFFTRSWSGTKPFLCRPLKSHPIIIPSWLLVDKVWVGDLRKEISICSFKSLSTVTYITDLSTDHGPKEWQKWRVTAQDMKNICSDLFNKPNPCQPKVCVPIWSTTSKNVQVFFKLLGLMVLRSSPSGRATQALEVLQYARKKAFRCYACPFL